MNDLEVASTRFTDELGKFLVEIQTSKKFDEARSREIENLADQLSQLLKKHSMLPKALLNEFRTGIRIIRAESEHSSDSAQTDGLANRLDVIFDLILMGESPSDRTPGVPRIV